MTSGVDISIILTAHNEGILAHKTMLSVFRAIKKLEENNISYEIVIHIDNGDYATKEYFKRYLNDKRVRILESSFGDPALSRNYSVESSNSKYVACFDADDLLSENWYIDAYEIVKKNKNHIARFNYIVTFGGDNTVITENKDFGEQEILYFVDSNLYGSPFMCEKNLFLKHQQRKNTPPYSYEDWQWNLDILSKGGINVVVPRSVIFYRQNPLVKAHVLNQHNSVRSTLSPTELLSYEYLKSRTDLDKFLQEESIETQSVRHSNTKKWAKEIIYHTLVLMNNSRVYRSVRKALMPVRNIPSTKIELPDWLIDEWREVNKIEKLTGPSSYTLERTVDWLPDVNAGIDYIKINRQLKNQPDTIFFMPWLVRGGADKVFINTANEVSRSHDDWNVAVFQTLPIDSPWKDKLDKDISVVESAKILSNLDFESQMRLMAMFISQNNIKRIVICNSKFAYDFILRYKTLIRHLDIKVYSFAFAGIQGDNGVIGGYVHEEIPLTQDVIYKIITDNSQISKLLVEEHAIDAGKFVTHHQFVASTFSAPKKLDKEKLKVLWASRITRSKLPELAKEIADNLDSSRFQVDMYGVLEDGYDEEFFANSNLNYIRRFDGIDDLPTDDYDIFLYTSSADGMPNMLLEIGSKGLPIIAPDIGGIKDFIRDGDTGMLIRDCHDVSGYTKAIATLGDANLRHKLASNAQKLLKSEYSKENWEKVVKEIFDK